MTRPTFLLSRSGFPSKGPGPSPKANLGYEEMLYCTEVPVGKQAYGSGTTKYPLVDHYGLVEFMLFRNRIPADPSGFGCTRGFCIGLSTVGHIKRPLWAVRMGTFVRPWLGLRRVARHHQEAVCRCQVTHVKGCCAISSKAKADCTSRNQQAILVRNLATKRHSWLLGKWIQ